MVEAIKHLLGCCGESHPSLFYLLGITPVVLVLKGRIVRVWGVFILIAKSCLRRLY